MLRRCYVVTAVGRQTVHTWVRAKKPKQESRSLSEPHQAPEHELSTPSHLQWLRKSRHRLHTRKSLPRSDGTTPNGKTRSVLGTTLPKALQRAPNHVVVRRRSRATPRPIFHSKRFCAPGEVAASATTPSCFARPTRIPAIRVVRPSASRSTRHCTTDATKRRTLGALACSEASSATTSAPNTLSSRSHPLDLPDRVVFV